MNVGYREYEERDFAVLSEMIFYLYEEDPEGEQISEEKIRRTISESAARPDKLRIIMICADEEVVGYSIICFVWSNEYGGDILNIDELYIHEGYRNNRIASDFIEYQIHINNTAVAIAAETTPSNESATRLYERLGFEPSPNGHLIKGLTGR